MQSIKIKNMKKYKKETTQFILSFGNNISLAKSEIIKLIQFYELKNNKEQLEYLLTINEDL